MIPIKWTLHQFISPFIEIISGGYGQLAALKTYNRDLKKRLGHFKGAILGQNLGTFTIYNQNLWLFLTFFGSFSGGYGQFAALKTYNRDLKTLIAIGGWNEGSRRFSPLVADASRRKTFIRSALRFLR